MKRRIPDSQVDVPEPEGFVPLCVPEIRGNEWKYVKECLDTNWVSSAGRFVERFEQMTAQYLGAEHAVATVSGTSALHVALLVAGVRPEEEVLVSDLTFVAPVNAIRYVGARPVFMDADPIHWQMDPEKVADFLNKECRWRDGALRNRATGHRVRAILPVHILGHPVDMDPILELAGRYELVVVEDAAESLGAKYRGRNVGRFGQSACLSFNGNKVITAGGGGMIVTDDEALANRARYLTNQAKDDPTEYLHSEIGYNYRLSNIHAALGVAQLERIDECVEKKRRVAAHYRDRLESLPGIECPREADWAVSSFWMYTVLVDGERFGMGSRDLMKVLQDHGIQTRPLWCPIHRLPPYRDCPAYRVETADILYERGLSLPCSVGVTVEQMDRVVSCVARAGGNVTRSDRKC